MVGVYDEEVAVAVAAGDLAAAALVPDHHHLYLP